MPTIVHEHDWPDRVVIGTVGRPGQRTFYLQVRTGRRTTSVALEKQWAALLAEKIDAVLDELAATEGNPFSVPEQATAELVDTDPVDQPVEEDFRLGSVRMGWDPTTAQLVVEAFPMAETGDDEAAEADEDEAEPTEALVLRIPVGTARAFAERTRQVVAAGRPTCPLCGEPMDPDGHACPPPRAV
jgi:uncharacterized repeat protein (TIGR03847 family)